MLRGASALQLRRAKRHGGTLGRGTDSGLLHATQGLI